MDCSFSHPVPFRWRNLLYDLCSAKRLAADKRIAGEEALTVGDWIASAEERLVLAGVESARLEAQLIAGHTLGQSRSWIVTHLGDLIAESSAEELLRRRLKREPLAYILGNKEFYGRRFNVRPGVLIPRPETECLIELVLDICRHWPNLGSALDVGTGSGCIAVTLALEARLQVTATDFSNGALDVARENALSLSAEVEFVQSDRFTSLQNRSFDIIVSNPPYIAEGEILMPEVADYEPPEALFAGSDGFEAYRWLMSDSAGCIAPGGWMCVEIGAGQAEMVEAIADACGWEIMRSMRDLHGHERVLGFRRRV